MMLLTNPQIPESPNSPRSLHLSTNQQIYKLLYSQFHHMYHCVHSLLIAIHFNSQDIIAGGQ